MTDKNLLTGTSKFLSYVLRHRPDSIGIELDKTGWVAVDVLLAGIAGHGDPVARDLLEEVVATNSKKRFAFSPDGTMIRANQGHGAEIVADLDLPASRPPPLLYHGTKESVLPAIQRQGLLAMSRAHVHLSADTETAVTVGSRRAGKTVVLVVHSGTMAFDGFPFYRSENGVWLTAAVPPDPRYLAFPEPGAKPTRGR